MWIRSQDRRVLVNTSDIYLHSTSIKSMNKDCFLGTYDSEERALEILDMIQDAIEDGMSCHEKSVIDSNGTTQSWKRHTVFEMPKI